jgi:hypothetical protein
MSVLCILLVNFLLNESKSILCKIFWLKFFVSYTFLFIYIVTFFYLYNKIHRIEAIIHTLFFLLCIFLVPVYTVYFLSYCWSLLVLLFLLYLCHFNAPSHTDRFFKMFICSYWSHFTKLFHLPSISTPCVPLLLPTKMLSPLS